MRGLQLWAVTLAALAAGCMSVPKSPAPPAAAVDITGTWRGVWSGYGILEIPRDEGVSASLTQRGSVGDGWIALDGTDSAESLPLAIRHAGMAGSRVTFDVSGSEVVLRHELGGDLFTMDFDVRGDRMVGRVRYTETPVTLELTRVLPRAAGGADPSGAPARLAGDGEAAMAGIAQESR
jgi:hypothetical protein